jgi:hypothetical protein
MTGIQMGFGGDFPEGRRRRMAEAGGTMLERQKLSEDCNMF